MRGHSGIREVSDLKPGDHLCILYRTEEEHRAVLTSFMRQGLMRNERIVYIVDAHTGEEVIGYLDRESLDVRDYLDRGQLVLLSVDDTYMKGGAFNPDGMIKLLTKETERALADGYDALRVSGEMSWALKGLPGSEKLIEYEVKLNRFFPGRRCLALCQYDTRVFDASLLLDVLTTHPIAVVGTQIYENFYYIPPEEYFSQRLPEVTLEHWIANLEARRKVDEALLRERDRAQAYQDFLQMLINTIPNPIFYKDKTGVYTGCNAAFESYIGLTKGQILGKTAYDIAPRELADRYHDMDMDLMSKRGVQTYEAPVRYADGSIHDVIFSKAAFDDRKGEVAGLVGVILDITERKRAEEEIARWSRRVSGILESISDAFMSLDQDLVVTYFNDAAERLLGKKREEVIGRGLFDVFREAGGSVFEEKYRQALQEREPLAFEAYFGIEPYDGWYDVRVYPFEDGISVYFQITTERKRVEEALRTANRELEAYAYVVSHDLRSPISVVMSAVSTLEELMRRCGDREAAKQAKEVADIISRSARNAEALIDNLLALARTGRATVAVGTSADIREIIRDVLMEKDADMKRRGMRVVMDEDLGVVLADPTQMYQLFSNLIANSIRYNDDPDPEIEISYRREGGGVHRYWVRDNGPGIPEGVRDEIFAPLFKGEAGGTGIGLAIVKKVVEAYGGDIEAYNNGGACFEFTLRDA